MNDMTAIIEPKSDQLNADSLISGPRTITITGVDIRPGTEQPCSIFFQGDEGRPWKPCKSMARVLVAAWGPDAKAYVGRSVTLYRDPSVKWGGMEVGGIRISHMSHIKGRQTMALTVTKGSKKPFVVQPLVMEQKPEPVAADALLEEATSAADKGTTAYSAFWKAMTNDQRTALLPHHERLKKIAADVDANAQVTE